MPTNMPPPRKLPQRSWAASIPTILTHSALNILLLPSPTPGLVPGLAGSYLCSPLERFLGSVIMRRHLQRIIQQETVWISSGLPSSDCQRQDANLPCSSCQNSSDIPLLLLVSWVELCLSPVLSFKMDSTVLPYSNVSRFLHFVVGCAVACTHAVWLTWVWRWFSTVQRINVLE